VIDGNSKESQIKEKKMMKKLIQEMGFLTFCFIMFLLPVKAAEDTISLTADGNKAEAILELPESTVNGEEIVSLQLSFLIETKQGDFSKNEISFEFDNEMKSAVQQYRYQSDSGILSIYISGQQNLFEKERVSLGKIVLDTTAQTETTCSVSVIKDSLKTVNSAFYMEEVEVNAPAVVEVTQGRRENDNQNPGNNNSSSDNNTWDSDDDDDDDDDDWDSDDDWNISFPGSNNNKPNPSNYVNNHTPNPNHYVNNDKPNPPENETTTIQNPENHADNHAQNNIQNLVNNETTTAQNLEQNTSSNSQNTENNDTDNHQNQGKNKDNTAQNQESNTSKEEPSLETKTNPEQEKVTIAALLESESKNEEVTETETTEAESSTDDLEAASAQKDMTSSKGGSRIIAILALILVIVIAGVVVVFKKTELDKNKSNK